MNNILVILNNPYNHDPRVKRQIDSLCKELKFHVHLVCVQNEINIDSIKKHDNLTIYRVLRHDNIFKCYLKSNDREINNIKNIVNKYNIKIVHAHDHISLELAVKLKKQIFIKIIYDAHEYISGWYYYKHEKNIINKLKGKLIHNIYSLKEKLNLKYVEELITVSNSLALLYKNKKKFKKNISVLRNVPNINNNKHVNHLKLREKLKISSEDILIIHSGGMYYYDEVLLYLISEIEKLNENVKLLFLCTEKDQIRLIKLVDLKKYSERIYLHNLVPVDELNQVLSEGDIGIMLNYKPNWPSHWFSLPNRIFDYMHAGLAVISTKQPEFEFIINKYKIGETFNLMEENSLCNCFMNLIKDIESFKANSLNSIEDNNWKIESEILKKIYHNIDNLRIPKKQ